MGLTRKRRYIEKRYKKISKTSERENQKTRGEGVRKRENGKGRKGERERERRGSRCNT